MENRKRNASALGLLVVAAGVLFVWGLFYMIGDPLWGGGVEVVVALEDGGGLKRGDRVHLHGVDVGSVRAVALRPDGRVSVVLRLDEMLSLPADTRAGVQGDVFGMNRVNLLPGTALVRIEEGDTLRGVAAPALPQLMAELGGRAQAVLANADSLLSPRTLGDVRATAATLPTTAQQLQAAFVELHQAAASLRRSAEGVEGAEPGPALSGALDELQGSARAFTAAAASLERSMGSLSSVLAKIDEGHGTLGRLVNDTTLYGDLQGALREVRALAADIRERPQRYVQIRVF